MKTIYLALTIDLDPDNFDTSVFGLKKEMSWRGIDEGLPIFLKKIGGLKDSFGCEPKITWFVRADKELFDIYGNYNYLFNRYSDFLNSRIKIGDEIGWHPHENKLGNLIASYEAVKTINRNFSSVRVGNSFHSNEFMSAFSKWGFKVDGTALSGRARNDKERFLDWRGTPEMPYFPSIEDYRLFGKEHHKILEVPFSMIKTQSYADKNAINRYLNLSYEHDLIKNSLCDLISKEQLLISIVHPSELLKNESKHPIISFDIDTSVKNLNFILKEAGVRGKKVKFITMGEIAELVKQKAISCAE